MGIKDLTFADNSAPQCDAEYLNSVRAEINGIITDTGQTPTTGTLTQLETAVSIYAAGGDFYTDSGAADAYVLSTIGSKKAPDAYFNGMTVRFLPGNVNTGASTVNVAALGSKDIKKSDGTTTPSAGDLAASIEVQLTYDGVNFRITASAVVAAAATPVDNVVTVTSTSNATTIDLDDADPFNPVFKHTFTENTTFTFSNPKGTGFNSGFKLLLINDGTGRTPTWPASVVWPGASEPDLTTPSETNILVFETFDAGTIWFGALAIGAAG